MTHEIKATWDELLRQSKDVAWEYFAEAHKILEGSELKYTTADVVALAKVMADDFRTTSIGVAAQKISEALNGVGTSVSGIGEAIVGVECALDSVAESITFYRPTE